MKPDIHVLVVHDSQSVREFAAQAITGWEGFATQEASGGAKGLEMALANPPDLILLALEMPRLDGFQFLDALHARQVDVPVVLITLRDSETVPAEMFRQGVKDYLTTPFTAEQLRAALERGLRDSDPTVRGACAWALGHYTDSRAQCALRDQLDVETVQEVREEILEAIG